MTQYGAKPDQFLPGKAKVEADKTTRRVKKSIDSFKNQLAAEDRRFEAFFPDLLGDADQEPTTSNAVTKFSSDFRNLCTVQLHMLQTELGTERTQTADFEELRAAMHHELDERVGRARSISDKVQAIREVQKAYWIVEAYCLALAAHDSDRRPLRIGRVQLPLLKKP